MITRYQYRRQRRTHRRSHNAKSIPYKLLKSRADSTAKNYIQGFNFWLEWTSQYKKIVPVPANPYHIMLHLLFNKTTRTQRSKIYST